MAFAWFDGLKGNLQKSRDPTGEEALSAELGCPEPQPSTRSRPDRKRPEAIGPCGPRSEAKMRNHRVIYIYILYGEGV